MELRKDLFAPEGVTKELAAIRVEYEGIVKTLKPLIQSLKETNKSFTGAKSITDLRKGTTELTKAQNELIKQQKLISDAHIKEQRALQALAKAEQEKLKSTQQLQRAEQQRLKTEIEAQKVIQAKARTEIQARKEGERLAKQEERAAKQAKDAASAYKQLSNRLNEARQKYKDLAASGTASTKQLRAQQRVVQNLDNRVKKIDASVGQFQRNVGNYPQLLGSATNALRNFAAAFGVIGGIQLFARAVQDTFKRIRDFDKELVNLAAVAGKTRPEIKQLEKEILNVSGSSINTANEVAQLATELIKLGSTTEEAEKLLKPVNDFSIALRASAEESASFLKGVLNAFGVGAEEAGRFGDVLSKAANRSALDFQKLTESFGFVAPTARQLGIPVERLAAQIGTLADNNIKASRAGRLLNTSFARLVTRGLSLDDALNQIRSSTDKVKTATELFGAESFTIGLILADNEEKVNSLTKEFENSKGSLEELTNKQLASLDAQLKILDSTWEQFILGVESGNGVLAETVKQLTGIATGLLNTANNLNTLTDSKYLSFFDKAGVAVKTWASYIPLVRIAFGDLNENTVKELEEIDKAIEKTTDGINKNFLFGLRGLTGDPLKEQIDNIRSFQKQLFISLVNDAGFTYKRATEISKIWAEQTILEFRNVAKGAKDDLKGVGETITEVVGNEFARAIDAISKGGLEKLLEQLKQEQADLNFEFEKMGGPGVKSVDDMTDAQKAHKAELDLIAEKIRIVNSGIARLGDEGVQAVKRLSGASNEFTRTLDRLAKEYEAFLEKTNEDPNAPPGLVDEELVNKGTKIILDGLSERGRAAKKQSDKEKAQRKRDLEDIKEGEDLKAEIIQNSFNVISEIFRGFADLRIQQISDELNALQHKRDREIEFIQESGATEEQKEARIAAINANFDARERALKQQQARAEKQAALFQIAINTAVGVASALKTPALIPFIIALGAAQAAFVAAQPLPKFKEGVKDAKGGPAIVSEEGSELLIDKGKAYLTPKQPSIIDVPRGADILPHDLTMKILANSLANNIARDSRRFEDERIVNTMNRRFRSLEKTIRRKPSSIIVGQKIGNQIGETKIRKINQLRF